MIIFRYENRDKFGMVPSGAWIPGSEWNTRDEKTVGSLNEEQLNLAKKSLLQGFLLFYESAGPYDSFTNHKIDCKSIMMDHVTKQTYVNIGVYDCISD